MLARGVARVFAVAPRRVPAHAGRARRRRLPRAARARGGAAAADGRVLAEPLPARVALSPRAGRRVPGHQPPAVAAGRRCWSQSWGEGFGLVHEAPVLPSLFIVGDRKQSIYRLPRRRRDAARRGGAAIRGLRPDGGGRRAISRSFRARAGAAGVRQRRLRRDRQAPRRRARRLPLRRLAITSRSTRRAGAAAGSDEPPLGVIVAERQRGHAPTPWPPRSRGCWRTARCAIAAPACRAPAAPGDIAILFRSRDAHREFERALEARGIPAYVYKGLGLLRRRRDQGPGRADPLPRRARRRDLRAAAFARSRFVAPLRSTRWHAAGAAARRGAHRRRRRRRRGVARSGRRGPAAGAGPRLARAMAGAGRSLAAGRRPRSRARRRPATPTCCAGPRQRAGARERQEAARPGAARQNRGYATMARIADHIDRLATGDEANAVRRGGRTPST